MILSRNKVDPDDAQLVLVLPADVASLNKDIDLAAALREGRPVVASFVLAAEAKGEEDKLVLVLGPVPEDWRAPYRWVPAVLYGIFAAHIVVVALLGVWVVMQLLPG